MAARPLSLGRPEATAELLAVFHSLKAGHYRAVLTVTRIRRRGGRERSAEMVGSLVTDFAVDGARRRRLTSENG